MGKLWKWRWKKTTNRWLWSLLNMQQANIHQLLRPHRWVFIEISCCKRMNILTKVKVKTRVKDSWCNLIICKYLTFLKISNVQKISQAKLNKIMFWRKFHSFLVSRALSPDTKTMLEEKEIQSFCFLMPEFQGKQDFVLSF